MGFALSITRRSIFFPDAKYAHYSLVAGVRGDELLIVDPSQQSGGVYFSDYRDILIGMDTHSELIQGKRGYIVLAPYGSEAFDRIHKGVIYLDENMYDKVTKQMGLYIARMSNLSAITDTMPSFLRKYLTGFNKEEQVSRVWRPKNSLLTKPVNYIYSRHFMYSRGASLFYIL